jgi:hypothetical protein
MLPAPVSNSLLILFHLLLPAFALAQTPMTPSQSAAIDQYISERKKIVANASPVVDQLGKQALEKLDKFENKLFPIVIWIDRRSAEMLAGEATLERTMKEVEEQSNFNPYSDPVWKDEAHKDLVQLCCQIKGNPAKQQQIQNRVANGLSPLPGPGGRNGGQGGPGGNGGNGGFGGPGGGKGRMGGNPQGGQGRMGKGGGAGGGRMGKGGGGGQGRKGGGGRKGGRGGGGGGGFQGGE